VLLRLLFFATSLLLFVFIGQSLIYNGQEGYYPLAMISIYIFTLSTGKKPYLDPEQDESK